MNILRKKNNREEENGLLKCYLEIEPYREIWFKDCFHMALIPAVIHNLGNADCLLLNHYWQYNYCEYGLIGKLHEFQNVYSILNNNGIKCNPCIAIPHEINYFIKDELLKKNYVIIGIDNYYERIRKDYYNIKHSGHSILINGCDDFKRVYNVIEQPFFYSYEYDKYNIEYEDVNLAHLAYIDRINDDNFFYNKLTNITRIGDAIPIACTIASKKINSQKENLQVRSEYLTRILELEKEKINSLSSIEIFADNFNILYSFCIDENKISNQIIRNLNDIINMRQIENYLNKIVLGREFNLENLGKDICKKLITIRTLIAKYMYSHIKQDFHINKGKDILKDLYNCELRYYTELYRMLRRIRYVD